MSVDPPSSSGSPDPDRPSKPDAQNEVTDSDLWNLDEDLPKKPAAAPTPRASNRKPGGEEAGRELSSASEKNVQRGKTKARPAERPKEQNYSPSATPRQTPDEIGDLEEQTQVDEEDAVLVVLPDDAEEAPPAPAPSPAKAPVDEPAPSPAAIDPALKSSEEPRRNRPKVSAEKDDSSWKKPNRRDIITLGSFAFLLLLVAIWVISRFFTQLHFESNIVEMPDYPVKGEHAMIAGADTYWREPIREGASRDVARREVAMIPVLDLTLDKDQTNAGALRIIFRNSEGTPIGDSITRSFSGGRFDASSDPKISFPATDGFIDQGSFNGYRTRAAKPWTADVLEGPSVDAPAGSFKKLVQIPVLPQRR